MLMESCNNFASRITTYYLQPSPSLWCGQVEIFVKLRQKKPIWWSHVRTAERRRFPYNLLRAALWIQLLLLSLVIELVISIIKKSKLSVIFQNRSWTPQVRPGHLVRNKKNKWKKGLYKGSVCPVRDPSPCS